MIARVVLPLLFFANSVCAQGFSGLGTDAEGFAVVNPNPVFSFPDDHGAHPAYRIEWWYLTATLTGADGQEYGVQWTLFRSALAPDVPSGWNEPQIWMGHAALTTPEQHYFAERFARGGIGQAGARPDPFTVWIDEWAMSGQDGINQLNVQAGGSDFAYDLQLSTSAPLVFHGQNGYSVKSPAGQASYYYSQPNYAVTGEIETIQGVAQVTGEAWLDREWSSQPLDENQIGWDWFSLSFADGTKMMAFQVRDRTGEPFQSGTWINPDGTTVLIENGMFEATPLTYMNVQGREVPTHWSLSYPDQELNAEIQALNPDSWMGTTVSYWEGPIMISGSHQGRGYLEMTGY